MGNIFKKNKTFFIAEISGNHDHDFNKAKNIIKKVAASGADAIKFQTFMPSEMTLNSNKKNFLINEKKSLWYGKNLYKLYKKSSMPWEWQKKLFSYAKNLGLIAFSSPFGTNSLNFLKKIKCPIYKIASLENSHFQLIGKVVKTKKPIILSTGSASIEEIERTVKFINKLGCKNLTLLKCTSTYPSKFEDLNLKSLKTLKNKFKCRVGFSDHSIGIEASLAAVALGAEVIEKHVKLSNKDKSIDSKFSITPDQLKDMVNKSEIIKKSLGYENKFKTINEKFASSRRRSIFVVRNLKKNEKITEKDIAVLRPNLGMNANQFFKILGKRVNRFIPKGTPLKIKYILNK